MREPFARVENRLWRTQFYVCVGYEKPSLGDTDPQKIDGYYDKKEAEFKCRKINAAHRAKVKRELEALKRECRDTVYRSYGHGPSACSESIQSIDIDAFMEREEKDGKRN
jgi:hypothetical protein